MSDVEQKLNMSLDDLAKKERRHPPNGGGSGGPQRRGPAPPPAGGPMSNWPWRGQGQQQPRMQPGGGGGFAGGRGMGGGHAPQQQQGPYHQQQQQGPYRQQQQPQRGSVFARLGGGANNAGGQQYMEQQQFQQQQQYPQHQRRQPHAGYMQQQQQRHQQPPQQQAPKPPPRPLKKPKLECVEEAPGHASLFHDGLAIVQVTPAGDVTLSSRDDRSEQRKAAFNIALSHFGISIREVPGAPGAPPSWSVSEGHRLTRFTDGMRIASRGPLTANRAAILLAAYGENSGDAQAAAEAAQEASRKAAIAAGLLPESAAGAGAASAEDVEAARVRRLKAQGRFMPY